MQQRPHADVKPQVAVAFPFDSMVHPNGSPPRGICHQRNGLKLGSTGPQAANYPFRNLPANVRSSVSLSVHSYRQTRMKGSLMTENPVPGASPEPTQQNQEPAGPQEGSPEQPHAGRAPEAAPENAAPGSPAPENPTLRLDRAEDGAPRPVYQQHQPSEPQRSAADTQQFGAPARRPRTADPPSRARRRPGQPSPPTRPTASPSTGQYGQYSQTQYGQSPYGAHLRRPAGVGSVLCFRPGLCERPGARPEAQGGVRRPDPRGQHRGGRPDRRRRGGRQ